MAEREEINIAPATGSRRFDKIKDLVTGVSVSSIVDYSVEAEINGVKREQSLGEFVGQRFPDSQQGHKPHYNSDLGKFVIKHADGTDWTQEDLDKAVKEIALSYEPKGRFPHDPKEGQPITSARLTDPGDPWINHSSFMAFFSEGHSTLRQSDPKQNIQSDMLRGNKIFMDENEDGIRSQDVMYIIKNPTISEDRIEKSMEEASDFYEYFKAMESDEPRMRSILHLFGIHLSNTLTIKSVRTELWKKADDDVTTERGITCRRLFLQYAKLPEDELQLREYVALGNQFGFIIPRAGIYEFNGATVGSTNDGVLEFFKSPHNASQWDALKLLVNDKIK